MPNDLYTGLYNPDVLSCLANLSNDEVFTPPEVANAMLDLLPQELFTSPDTKFLDPACKSGVFLREIAKRLIRGLADKIPDLQQRLDHIFHEQLYGIAITELTSLLSRRSVYCSKYPNGAYSVSKFENAEGNIRFKMTQHRWQNGKCAFCGASQGQYDRDVALETHAYEFIHTIHPKEIMDMKFDVIIGNPPYQLSTTKESAQATPLYDKFVLQAKKLNPRYLCMIIPARWYAGGMGLDQFRSEMVGDRKISYIVDYPNAGECFPGIELRGGVCYFLWDRSYNGDCKYSNVTSNKVNTMERDLSQYDVFVRWNEALSIIEKVQTLQEQSLTSIVSAVSPFGIPTTEKMESKQSQTHPYRVFTSKGDKYVSYSSLHNGYDYCGKYKVLISQLISGNLETPPFKVISRLETMEKTDVCTHTYLVGGQFASKGEADNLRDYLKTRFARFLLLQRISNMHISKDKFRFVPIQDFKKSWTDEELYAKYGLTDEEIAFIESMIKPME